jgi:hypothetical protein
MNRVGQGSGRPEGAPDATTMLSDALARMPYQTGDEVALGSSWVGCDDGDGHGYFAIDRGDHYDGQHAFGLNNE